MKWVLVMMLLMLALFVACDDADGDDIRWSGWRHNHGQYTGLYNPYQYRHAHYPSSSRYRSFTYDYRIGRASYYRRTYPVWNPQPVYQRRCYPIHVR